MVLLSYSESWWSVLLNSAFQGLVQNIKDPSNAKD